MSDLQPRPKLTWSRRIGGAVVILVVAGLLTVFSSQQQRRITGSVETFAADLCAAAAAGRPLDPILVGTDQTIAASLGPILRERLGARLWGIDVHRGDKAPRGDGSATHSVMILVDGTARLGLRIVQDDPATPPRVIGYWAHDG